MIFTEWKILGQSVNRQDIPAAFIGVDQQTILLIGCTHGDEKQGKDIVLKTLAYFEEHNLLLKEKQLVCVPVLNPDGYKACTRGNANGVDINRNFPCNNWELSPIKDNFYSGPAPGSEPETKVLIEMIESVKPSLILTIHQPYKVVNFDGPAKKYAKIMANLNKYEISESIGYPTPGSLGTYAGIERNIPIITLELPENDPDEIVWKDNSLAIIAAINHT
jgi:murein peptide amidase A